MPWLSCPYKFWKFDSIFFNLYLRRCSFPLTGICLILPFIFLNLLFILLNLNFTFLNFVFPYLNFVFIFLILNFVFFNLDFIFLTLRLKRCGWEWGLIYAYDTYMLPNHFDTYVRENSLFSTEKEVSHN